MTTLEKMLLGKGVSQSDITVALQASAPSSLASPSSDNVGGASAAELSRLNDKLSEQQKHVAKLQRKLDEYGDLDELKAQFEEYEHNVRQELDEARQIIEDEKSQLTHERMKLLKDRSGIDEKESRIGIVITNLDEKESKLRQLMATMREQQEQWNRSVNDLQRREDLVDDWQRNHKQREKKLLEIEQIQEKKFAELNKREAVVLEEENRVKQVSSDHCVYALVVIDVICVYTSV
ncbi:hypothetical protein EON65_44685 [archaeon]|nr:MAG: hypothetical protein EON65_44685 [archaeon]